VTSVDVDDFHEIERGTDVIFHDAHDLLFVISGNNCYFVPTPDHKEHQLAVGPARQTTEMDLVTSIFFNSHDMVKASSMDEVREEFKDVLADYHCKGKQIFYVDYFEVKRPPPTTPPTTAPTMPPTTAPPTTSASATSTCVRGPSRLSSYCRGKTGMFPYPGNCRKFVTCNYNMAFPFNCPDGTSWDASRGGCLIIGTKNNPCC